MSRANLQNSFNIARGLFGLLLLPCSICIIGFGIEHFLQSLYSAFKAVDVYRRSRLIRCDRVRRDGGIPSAVRLFEPDNGVVLVHQQNRAVRSEPERLCAVSSVHAGNLTRKALHRSYAVLWACRGISAVRVIAHRLRLIRIAKVSHARTSFCCLYHIVDRASQIVIVWSLFGQKIFCKKLKKLLTLRQYWRILST
uniref:Uncharacterized protein n=1 Tax=Siphoviridae sp. ctD2Q91 TaxID=2825383 RepID=A0A8S5PPX9_9CAUD|nr:MAG TPA: hypothetical protein [Siphoviridae sp. ctD2Q91]